MNPHSLPTQELVRECFLTGSEEAWTEFISRFDHLIAGVVFCTARRWGAPAEGVDDLVQDVYLKLYTERANLLDRFEAEHPESFYGYLKVITANLVQDHFKAQHARKRGAGVADVSLDAYTPAATTSSTELNILLGEIDGALANSHFSREQRVLFWLHYREGFTASAIAALPATRLSVKGVESLLVRMIHLARKWLGDPALPVRAPREN